MNSPNNQPRKETRDPSASRLTWRNPWAVVWVLVVFVILSVNGVMVYLAASSSPGLVQKDYYERGRNYEKTIQSRRALANTLSLGIQIPSVIRQGEPATFVLVDTGEAERPLRPDTATLYAYRPSDCDRDFSVPMEKIVTENGTEQVAAHVVFPLKGVWDVIVSAEQGGIEYDAARRVVVASD